MDNETKNHNIEITGNQGVYLMEGKSLIPVLENISIDCKQIRRVAFAKLGVDYPIYGTKKKYGLYSIDPYEIIKLDSVPHPGKITLRAFSSLDCLDKPLKSTSEHRVSFTIKADTKIIKLVLIEQEYKFVFPVLPSNTRASIEYQRLENVIFSTVQKNCISLAN